jgi:hypothetical protein
MNSMRQHARYVHDNSPKFFQADEIDQLERKVIGMSEKVAYRIRRIVKDRGYIYCSCIFEVSGYLLDLILFLSFVSRLFAFPLLVLCFRTFNRSHAIMYFSEIFNFRVLLFCRGLFFMLFCLSAR